MRRVLIAGCGYLGQATAALFHELGWEVEGWTLSAQSAQNLSTRSFSVHAVDISDTEQIAARPGNFDAVMHCASTRGGDIDLYRRTYFQGAGNLLERFPRSTMLFTSSTSVYAQSEGDLVTEQSAAEPEHEGGKILRETEQLVLGHGGIVARLAGIYGPGRSYLVKRILTGEAIIDPKHDRFVNQVHRDDAAAAALFLLLERPSVRPEIYNVVDDQPILQSACYRWLAEKLNRPLPRVAKSIPKRKRGESNKRVSNAKLRRLGWSPRYPTFAEGMEKSVLPTLVG
jgi:nucleoside-diphosphate-sugar epimerase